MKARFATTASRNRFVRLSGILTIVFAAALLTSALPSFSASAETGGSFISSFLGFGSAEPQEVSATPDDNGVVVSRTVCAAGCDLTTVAAAVAEVNASVPAGGVIYNVAAGHTETATAGGYTITATGTSSSQIVFRKDPGTVGTNPTITASAALTVGSLHDAIFEVIGGDYITISGFTMLENPANTVTAAATNTMTEFGVALFYATTTDGAQNVTIQGNTIDLDRTYQNTFGIYSNSTHAATTITVSATATTLAGGNSALKVYSNTITDVNQGIVVVGPTAAVDNNEVVDIGGASIATGNTITNYGTTGTFSGYANVSGTVNGVLVRNSRNFNISFNTITSSAGGTTAGTLNGVQIPAFSNAPTGTFTNSINNNVLSVRSGLIAGAINGINSLGTTASTTSTLNINNNDFNNFGHTVAGTATITLLLNSGTHQHTNITNNTFTNLNVNTTGSVVFISNSTTNSSATGTKNVNGNMIVTGFNKTGAGGTVTLFTDNGSDVAGSINNSNNNNFSNITVTGATTIAGWSNTNGGAPTKTVTGNTFSNWTGGTSAVTGMAVSFSGNSNVSNNVVSNITNGGAITGITSGSGTVENFSQNTVHTLTGTGTGAVTGMSNTGGTTKNFFKNKIYNLENNNAAGAVNGFLASSGTTVNVFNNLIGDLRTPAVSAVNALNGINVTSATATSGVNVSYNTVYLNAISSGANFGSSALQHTVSATATTASLTARNNIFVNLSTPAGTGLTVSFRRSGIALDNYNAASNNNDFYAGTPGATRLIFYDGTNSDQTIGAYRSRVAPRDSNSVTENPTFVSTTGSAGTFLHINAATPTQLEGGGTPVAGITDDYDGDARNVSTPDIGADEFVGIGVDLSAPTISYTSFTNTTLSTNRNLTVTITDASGVAGGALAPRIYFRKNAGAYFSTQCSGSSPTYTCTIDNTLIGGVVTGDVVDYFVVAQDTLGNVGANPSGGFTATDVNNVTTPPTVPNTYTIVVGSAASINVGTGETFTSLTNAGGVFAALNAGVLTNNVTVNVTTDLTAETGAIALNQQVEEGAGAGTYTVTIKPSAAARVISGTNGTGALIKLNGADRVTIDGSTSGGSDRSLTITNNSTATATAAIHIISLGVGAGATNNTVKNTNLSCGADQSTSTSVTYGISQGNNLLGNSGADNDDNSFINNLITKVNIGIYSSGANAANPVQNTIISNNVIGPAAFGSDQIGRAGIIFNLTNGATVTGNEVRFVGVLEPQTSSGGSYDKFGISHAFNGWSDTTFGDLAVSNTIIARNRVHDIVEENTFSAVGIFMAGGNGSNDTLNRTVNNFIWNVRANGTSGDNSVSLGIGSGRGDTVAFNSIYAAGDLDPGVSTTASQSSFGLQITSTTAVNLTLRDNIVYTDMTSNTLTLKHGSIKIPTGFAWGTGGSNYNDLYVPVANTQAIVGRINVTDAVTLGDWQTASGQDANSKSVDPLFVSATDLHLQSGSTLRLMGLPVSGVTTDIDGDTRHPATPDIGADEFASFVLPAVQFSSATYSGAEGTNATITVTRTGDLTVASSVNFATSNGTATGGASCGAGVDYVTNSGTLNFAISDASETFDVQLCSDVVVKGDETINLTLSAPVAATLGTPSTAVLTITNVNPPMPGVLALSSATYSVGEAGGTVTITVNRTGGTDGAVSVNYGLTDGTATGGAACGGAVDYVNTGGTVNFINGQNSQTFTVAICNDAAVEGNETFTVGLSGATGGATIGSPSSAVVTITDDDTLPTGNVVVNPGNVAYATLGEAVTAINAGTHTGAVTVDINANTTETGAIVLNSSGAGSASYTSLIIRPTVDAATVAGPTATGRGLLELNGADNVTIDGDNATTGGTNRNLTFQNTAVNTTTFTSVIRVALNTTTVITADNNIIRNLKVVGSATGRNVATTVTTDSQNNTYGILATANASGATTAPTAISSLTTVIATGATATNFTISNNSFETAGRAVSVQGSAVTVFPGLAIQNNAIGNPTAAALDQIYVRGISAQGSSNGLIAGNTVYVEGFVGSSGSSATVGIDVGGISAIGTFTIEKNKVNRVQNNNTQTWATYGINLAGGSNHVVQNNFVSGILNNQVAGTGGFGTTFGAYGIRVGSGTGHDVFHNSVHLYGAMPGVISTNLTAAFMIVATGQTGVDVRNNIFSNQVTGGNPASPGTRHVAVFLPSGATVAMNLTINNNAYYQGTDPLSRMAQVGITFGVGEYQAADFDPTSTTPASNFRAYTSTLSAAGTNDNASFATTAPPPFTSNTDLHIPVGTATRLESGGAAVGVTDDIDLETRNATTPDIGADEFAGNPPTVVNDIAAVSFVTPANGSTIQTGPLTPQARFSNQGTVTQTNVTVRFRIINSSMTEIYNQTAIIPSILPLQIITVSFPSTMIATPGTYSMVASAELAGDQNAANDTINGTFSTVVPIGGTVSVGTGETYTSLTNPGGLFQALNVAGLSSSLVVNITSDLTGETGVVPLNQLAETGAGGYTVTFKPSGAARTISGTAASLSLIKLNGADRITFDGSLSGGTDRSLTILYTNTGGTVFWIASQNAGNGSNNNTIKNCVIGSNPGTLSIAGVLAGSGTTLGSPAEAANSNNTIQNNLIFRVQNSAFLFGPAAAGNLDQNWLVTGNEFGTTVVAEKNIFRGMLLGNAQNFVVSNNFVHGILSTAATASAMSGIQIAGLANGGSVTGNTITDIRNQSATGTGAFGFQVSATSANSNTTFANNSISDVSAVGSATIVNNGHGINVNGAASSGWKFYHNSVNMNTNQTSGTTSAFNVVATVVAAGAIDLRNNILANTQTAGATRRSVHSAAAASVFSSIDYNDYFSTGSVGFIGALDRPTLADWQTGTGQDVNSKAVDPLFVSPTNLHIQAASPMINMGVAGTGITTDIDGQARDAMPDIGADEIVSVGNPGTLQFSSATYSVGEAGPTATITVTRTGGTTGTVTVDYATVAGGTATGGASCTAGIDYVNASGTLTFVNGDASETFNVTVCNDVADEPDETVNMALTNATGGATIGSPSTAVLTITDDDLPAGSFAINDVRVFEGNSGATNAQFTVTYTGPVVPVSVQYSTANGTAVAGVDYLATSGTLNFNSVAPNGAPAPQTQTVTVVVIGDVAKEANETYFVNLSNPTNATIADGQGVGIIIDEDRAYVADFDRDRVSDFSVFRPSESRWYVLQSASASLEIVDFGSAGDIAVPGDYDGDGSADYAVWRPSTGTWYRILSSNSSTLTTAWGVSGDKPVQGDYDGDGKTDLAVYRPSTGTWWILRSSNGATSATPFGISTDRPVQGDYDGDAKTDIAVYRNGTWYIARSSDGAVQIANFGLAADRPVSGDFDGDGKFDLAIYRDGVWWILRSLTGTALALPWGTASDIPVPADYDADGTTDFAVFRPSTGDWYVLRSSNSTSFGIHWGLNGDVPVPAAYLPQ